MDPKEPHKQQQQQQQNQQPPHWMLTGPYGRNAAALMGPTSTSQAMQHRLPIGSTPWLRQPQQPPHWMLTGSYGPNAAALMGPTSASLAAMQHRLSLGSTPSLLQPQQPLGLAGSLSSVATQQPSTQIGDEQRPLRPRGRPRKYADLSSASDCANANASDPSAKRGRGRSPGSCNKKKLDALEGEGSSLTAHIIHVKAGEDIAAKIVAFMNQEPREVCILSASGAVSSAVLQCDSPTGILTYEDPYYIIGMSGSFLNTESNGTVTRTVNLTVSLAGPNGLVVGGIVAGMLVAGSPVQVVVGSFVRERVNVENNPEPTESPQSQSQGPPRSSESSEPRY